MPKAKDYPDNTVLLQYLKAQFRGVDGEFNDIKDHLRKLNSQVEKNSAFRNRALGIWVGIAGIWSIFIGIFTIVASNFF